jgi:hypothetical protein
MFHQTVDLGIQVVELHQSGPQGRLSWGVATITAAFLKNLAEHCRQLSAATNLFSGSETHI